MAGEDIRNAVKQRYAEAALRIAAGSGGSCCTSSTSGSGGCSGASSVSCQEDPITGGLYDAAQTAGLPDTAVAGSLGCGNPTLLATLAPGETVLDLGSGGGLDVLLSARRVGPEGKAIGLDMTDRMLDLARENARRSGVTNVEFLKGEIEEIPLPDSSVDVVISNCVINLSADKDRVFAETFRVLRPGGRLAVSDVVVKGTIPPEIRRSLDLWAGCIGGALEESDYRARLHAAGFTEVEIEPTRIYDLSETRTLLEGGGVSAGSADAALDGAFRSAFIRARKPGGK